MEGTGVSADYTRSLSDRWFVAASLAWDSETEVRDGTSERNIKSLTPARIVACALTPWMSISSGLGKGSAGTDNPAKAMRFANGDLGTGVGLGFATRGLPLFARDSVGFSVVYEYNLSARESSLSVDGSFAWSFYVQDRGRQDLPALAEGDDLEVLAGIAVRRTGSHPCFPATTAADTRIPHGNHGKISASRGGIPC
jgi:hypothetical protein